MLYIKSALDRWIWLHYRWDAAQAKLYRVAAECGAIDWRQYFARWVLAVNRERLPRMQGRVLKVKHNRIRMAAWWLAWRHITIGPSMLMHTR